MADMDALVLNERGVAGLRLERRQIPEPGLGEALVRVEACGVGGTVLNKVNGLPDEQLPRVPGHEFAGEVVAVGPGVTWPRVGDRVMAYYYVTCGRCRHCWEGSPARCTNQGEGEDRLGENRDGAYAQYACAPVRNLLPIPDGLGAVEATVAIDALATPLHVGARAGVQPAERLVVIGAGGGVGIHLLQAAELRGAQVVGIDRADKLEAIQRWCPTALLRAADDGWSRELAGTVDVVVDLVGTEATREQAFGVLGRGGRLVVLTVASDGPVSVASGRLVSDEITIVGSKYASHAEVTAAAQLLLRGTVHPVITSRGGLASVPEQLAAIGRGEVIGRGVLDLTADRS